jgi:hypothetical protein
LGPVKNRIARQRRGANLRTYAKKCGEQHLYRLYQRLVDVEGYVALHTNRYSVPVDWIGRRVEVRETKDKSRFNRIPGVWSCTPHCRSRAPEPPSLHRGTWREEFRRRRRHERRT